MNVKEFSMLEMKESFVFRKYKSAHELSIFSFQFFLKAQLDTFFMRKKKVSFHFIHLEYNNVEYVSKKASINSFAFFRAELRCMIAYNLNTKFNLINYSIHNSVTSFQSTSNLHFNNEYIKAGSDDFSE
jgi:hypothetical protein